jgi:hypothetical protein
MKKYVLLLVLALNAHADVLSSGPNGFEINIERTAMVDAQTAYAQFLRVDEWWHPEHTWFGDASGLYIEPNVGGCFCEKSTDKAALHMTVSYIVPGKEVRMVGGLGPLQMMGVHGGMSWRFVAVGDSETKIIQHYQVSGFAKDGLAGLAPVVDQVQTLQHERLVSLLHD